MMGTDLAEAERQAHDNQIISIIFQTLYYFGAFADLGHIGITSICRHENCFHMDTKDVSALVVTNFPRYILSLDSNHYSNQRATVRIFLKAEDNTVTVCNMDCQHSLEQH